jgi:hypothetical protein
MGGYMRSNILICLLAVTLAAVTQKVLQVEQMVIENEAWRSGNEQGHAFHARIISYHAEQMAKKGK